MYTYNKVWDVVRHDEVATKIEEQVISLVGHDIYEKFMKDYSEKQWHEYKDIQRLSLVVNRVVNGKQQ